MLSALDLPPRDVRHSSNDQAEITAYRQRTASALGIAQELIFFTHDATFALNAVLRGALRAGDTCFVDNRAHNAITRTLHALPAVATHYLPLHSADDLDLDLPILMNACHSKPQMFCFTHVSNVSGAAYPVATLIATVRAHSPASAICIDACQSAGVLDLKEALEADFIVFSGHKFLHAPPGAAVLIARRPLEPIVFGGTGTHSADLVTPTHGRHFAEVGTPNLPAIAGLVAALEDDLAHREQYAAELQCIIAYLWEALSPCASFRRLGPPPSANRGAALALQCLDAHPELDLLPYLRAHHIVARAGLHCAPHQHLQLGLPQGTLRLSPSRFSTTEELDQVARVLASFTTSWSQSTVMIGGPVHDHGPTIAPEPGATSAECRLIFNAVRPCAEAAGATQVEGSLAGSTASMRRAALEALGWQLQPIGPHNLFARRPPLHLYLDTAGAFTLSRAQTEHDARQALDELCAWINGHKGK